jgi:hypothetical protein
MFPEAIVNGSTFEVDPFVVTEIPSEQLELMEEFNQNVIRESPRGTEGFVVAPHSATFEESELARDCPQAFTVPDAPKLLPQIVTAAPLVESEGPAQPVLGPQVKSEKKSAGWFWANATGVAKSINSIHRIFFIFIAKNLSDHSGATSQFGSCYPEMHLKEL